MKIGLTQRILIHNGHAYDATSVAWYSYLQGHTLVTIPNRIDQDFEQLAVDLDAVIITGGDDCLVRRRTEVKLATEVLKRQKPIIGVCHGAFLLTDLLKGTVSTKDGHRNTEHPVVYRNQEYTVNSYHGLYINQAPASSQILVTDIDGHCEAWIDGKIAAVVWHPERMKRPWLPDEIQTLFQGQK